jgi:hypothetical protein
MQTTLKRRFSRGLMSGLAHPGPRCMGATAFDPPVAENETRDYGPGGADRRHIQAVNYGYDPPKLGMRMNNKAVGAVIDNWSRCGVSPFIAGAPVMPSFASAAGVDIAGPASAQVRLAVVGDSKAAPSIPGTYFNTAAFAQPARGTLGDPGLNPMTGPGTNDWDATFSKTLPCDRKGG